MDTTNVKLTAGQLNDLPKSEVDFRYIAPIEYLVSAFIINGKIRTVSDINDFINRNRDFADVIQKKIAYLIDGGAISFSDDYILINYDSNKWSENHDAKKALTTIPDISAAISRRGLIARDQNLKDPTNFSFVRDFPDTPEIRSLLEEQFVTFYKNLIKISKFAEKNEWKSKKVMGVSLSSGPLIEEDFS